MFTGLVEAVGTVTECTPANAGVRVRIRASLAGELSIGDSLAVNGVCLTATAPDPAEFHADIGPETLRVTSLGQLAVGTVVNLERPLRADSRMGGHFVQGHVDATGEIEELRPEADFYWLKVRFPSQLAPYLIPKGSVAVDGISLTVAQLAGEHFTVQIVPFTFEHTNLRHAKVGDRVNLECDMVGKYVVRAVQLAGVPPPARPNDPRAERA